MTTDERRRGAQLLRDGAKPIDLVHQGFSRGTVYKVHKQLREEGGTPMGGGEVEAQAGDSLDKDPEILDLIKAVRKAHLKKELAEIKSQARSEVHLIDLETRVSTLEENVEAISTIVEDWIS